MSSIYCGYEHSIFWYLLCLGYGTIKESQRIGLKLAAEQYFGQSLEMSGTPIDLKKANTSQHKTLHTIEERVKPEDKKKIKANSGHKIKSKCI